MRIERDDTLESAYSGARHTAGVLKLAGVLTTQSL